MKQLILRMGSFLLVLLMVLSLASCGGNSESETQSAEPPESRPDETTESTEPFAVRVGSTGGGFVYSLDPTGISTAASHAIVYLVYDPLIYWNPVTDEAASDVLSDWYYAPDDHLTLYLVAAENVFFSNGDPLTGEDILYTIECTARSRNRAEYFKYVDLENSYVDEDGMTVAIKFTEDYGPGIKAWSNVYVVNKSWIEDLGGPEAINWFDLSSHCGSGPYSLTDFQEGYSATLTYNEDWWNNAARGSGFCEPDEITLYQYNEPTTMMIDYENGDLDSALFGLTSADLERFDAGEVPGVCETINTNSTITIVLNVNSEKLSDPRVREAICCAIDADGLADATYGKLGQPADSVFASTLTGYVGGNGYEYDPDRAAALLEEAGASGLTLQMICTSDNTETAVAEMIQAYLSAVGITLEISTYDEDTAIGMWMDPATCGDLQQFRCSGGSILRDPAITLSQYESNSIFAIASRKEGEVYDYMTTSLENSDEAIRTEAYENLQRALHDTFDTIPVCEWYTAFCYNTDTVAEMHIDSGYAPNLRWFAQAN